MKISNKKIVIGIHGLGNKPPENILREWWKSAILEGLKKYNYPVNDFSFELVYWADILHKVPLDPKEQNKKSPQYMSEKYIPEHSSVFTGAMTYRKKAIEFLEKYYDKILINGVLSLNNQSFMDLFIHLHLRDLEKYYSSSQTEHNGKRQLARELIIERFCETIKKHSGKKIFLVAHSMGSIIVQDALSGYLPDIKIDTLVTIGSPLAQKYVIHKIQQEGMKTSTNKFKAVENIEKNWLNLSDYEDQVALNHNLRDFYKSKIKKW